MNSGKRILLFIKTYQYELIFAVALIWFYIWALNLLKLPLFWDEIGVYGRGIFSMMDSKISLHPDALPPEISRGHPLLFTYLIAGWGYLFGDTVMALRAAALLVSLLFIVSAFWLFPDREGRRSPFPVIVVLVQPVFLAQSTLLLPEMMLSLFTLLAIAGYLRRQYWLYFLAASAMILVKETALILVCGFVAFDFLNTLIKEKKLMQFRFLLYLLPLLPYLLFLWIQKQTHGWYFFPYHMGGFNLEWKAIKGNLDGFLTFLFVSQGRYLWLILGGLVVGVWLTTQKSWKKLLPIFQPFDAIALFLSLVYLLFYCTTYYMNRYILVIVLLVALVLGRGIWQMVRQLSPSLSWLPALVLIGLMGLIQAPYQNSGKFTYDEDMSYRTYTKATRQAIHYFLEQKMYEQPFHVNFPLDFALLDHRYGYLPDSMETMLNYPITEETQNVLLMVPPQGANNPKKQPLTQVHNWWSGYVEIRHLKPEE